MEWFIWLCFGHFFADWAFQNDWMALNKKNDCKACLVHCTIYTGIVTTFLHIGGVEYSYLLYALIFASHWVLDYTDLVYKWMKFYKIRSWNSNLPRNLRDQIMWDVPMHSANIVKTIFGAMIYVVIDTTSHLFMMFLIVKALI